MSQLGCKCGERMTKTDCPSPCSIAIFYKEEIDNAIRGDSSITLHDFLSGWDAKNYRPCSFMARPVPVDYWFCPACKRVYEVQNIPQGRWLRVYARTDTVVPNSFDEWKQIYVMPDVETDAATEDDFELLLSAYLKQHDGIVYHLSPEESIVCAVDRQTGSVLYSYSLEDSWSSSD